MCLEYGSVWAPTHKASRTRGRIQILKTISLEVGCTFTTSPIFQFGPGILAVIFYIYPFSYIRENCDIPATRPIQIESICAIGLSFIFSPLIVSSPEILAPFI